MKQVVLPCDCPAEYTAEKELFHHLIHVLRFRVNTKLFGLDKNEQKYKLEITSIEKNSCTLKTEKIKSCGKHIPVVLYQSLPKGKKLETIIRAGTELGISAIIPMKSEFSLAPIPDEKKYIRYRKIRTEALQQSGTSVYTRILPAELIEDLPKIGPSETGLLFHQDADKKTSLFSIFNKELKKVYVLVGPEGGFSPSEVEILVKKGYIPVLLNNNVLKLETAAVTAAGVIIKVLMERGFE